MTIANLLFSEVQSFRQPLLWISFVGICVFSLGINAAVWRKLPEAMAPALRYAILVFPIAIVGLVGALLWFSQLTTEVRAEGLYVKFFPLQMEMRRIDLAGATCKAVEISPMKDYGGWGLRVGKGGTAYLVSGDKGVRIDYPDGGHVFIGSARSEELAQAIGAILPREP
jgi:hypothetical protein